MCIAIVKTAGNPISEEHLEDGWKANNDGAGFAYINTDGEIIIERFMKWEEFLPVYREAVEKYGDTSDFLIHFRITSKGTTELDNCHPFRVDNDKVIIHNGTISEIDIKKGDDRSDTRILAEDFLSQLPENWEDNWVITAFLESFIGYSKVCMLHRTKGVYIFNEDKGLWVDKNWYSNESYKPRTIYYGGNNTSSSWSIHNTGFYSYKLNKWIDDNAAKNYTIAERKDHTDWNKYNENVLSKSNKSSSNSSSVVRVWKRCDCCAVLCEEGELWPHTNENGEQQKWCVNCIGELETCEGCNKDFRAIQMDEYWNPALQSFVSLCDNCHDFFKETNGVALERKFATTKHTQGA